MFNPTKTNKEGGERIRIGNTIPKDAVAISYVHTPALRPEENVHISDFSGFTLENAATRELRDEDLWPNDQGLLTSWDGSENLRAKSFILTNEFKDGEPLYYAYDLMYPAASRGGIERAVASVLVETHLGEALPPEKKYKVVASKTDKPNLYAMRIFTSFQVQPNETIRVTYSAYKSGRTIPAYAERLVPTLAFRRHRKLEEVVLVPNRKRAYYQSEGRSVGESNLYVGSVPIRDLDHRVPVPFRYRLVARSVKGNHEYVISTPWVYDSVFHSASLSIADVNYQNGHKRLRNRTAFDIIADFGDIEPLRDPEADVEFSVESSNEEVHTYTQADGRNMILAYTDTPTDSLRLPDDHRVQNRVTDYSFLAWVRIDGGERQLVKGTANISEGHKLIAGPFEGSQIEVGLVRPYDPVNIYVKDNALYVYTDETDTFYVPRFSMRTESNSRIQVLPARARSEAENWYVQIQNGQFSRMSSAGGFRIEQYYSVPEYFRQGFDEALGMPFKKVLNETAQIIGKQRVRLRNKQLHIELTNDAYNIEIQLNGEDVKLMGWDAAEGTLEVGAHLKDGDVVTVSYYYEEHSYEYRGFLDPETGKFWHLDLNPGPGHFYLAHDERTGETRETPSFHLINQTVYLYMKPTALFTEEGEMVRMSYQESAIFHSFTELDDNELILLAKIYVRPNASSEHVKLFDIRTRGGGLKENINAATQQREKDTRHYWDVARWDGTPYAENGVIVVRIPSYILDTNGGRFTKEEAEEAVQRHLGYGILPIIEYVNEPQKLLERPEGIQIDFGRGEE